MTKFEDELFGQLLAEHGHRLRSKERPAQARHRARRPAWLAAGGAGAVAAVTAGVMALGSSAPAEAAYSVIRHANGTLTVSVSRPSGVAGANVTLHAMGARVVVVPVRPGCPAMGSLPHPNPAPHPAIMVATGVNANGHVSVTVKVWGKNGIPAGDTVVVAFYGHLRGTMGGAAGIITGRVPSCVSLSLPPAPQVSGNSGAGSTETQQAS
jgi:hypothetical protein